MNLYDLNEPQRLCVKKTTGPVILLAGAGTGKTRVITYRIAYMIAQGIPASQIVALTFTNKAAREMQERIGKLCSNIASELNIGTFHSFCLRLLRQHSIEAGLSKKFSIASTSDQLDLVRKALAEKNWNASYRVEELLRCISFVKNKLWSADDILDFAKAQDFNGLDPQVIFQVFKLYERQLRLFQIVDFDDCIYRFVYLLNHHPEIKDSLIGKFQYFLVDEFQDTNFSQLKILEKLCIKNRNICVVGDDDQSIYSWRGAMAEVLLHFEELFPERELIKLEQNYRCTNIILNAANTVIKNNSQRKSKVLWCESVSQESILLSSKEDEIAEARWIAQSCIGLLGRGVKACEIAILYRTNALAKNLEIAMREHNLHYKVYGGQSFFERKEVKDILSYLRLIADRNQRLPFLRIANFPSRGFGLRNLEMLEEMAQQTHKGLFFTLKARLGELAPRLREKMNDFIERVEKLGNHPIRNAMEFEEFVNKIISEFSLIEELRKTASSADLAQRKVDLIRKIPSWLAKFSEKKFQSGANLVLSDLIDDLTMDETEFKEEQAHPDSISLMSIHAAKGLEFTAVFVCGLEDGVFPHQNSFEQPKGIDEERRLFYVAITRAKKHLFLSYPCFRSLAGGRSETEASRFLAELPNENLLSEEMHAQLSQASEDEKKERTRKKLSSLRESFKGL